MKESKILKVLSYILIPILILIIFISGFYGIEKEEFREKESENLFESDWFVNLYMGRLSEQCYHLIHDNNSYNSMQDNDYKICYNTNYLYYNNYYIKDFYYLIIYKNIALTNVELTTQTNSIEKIKTFISNQDSKKANIINGEVSADSELISNKAIQYFDYFDNVYYVVITNTGNQLQEMPNEEYYEIENREYHNVDVKDFQIYSSYKEELVPSSNTVLLKNVIDYLGKYEQIILIAMPVSSILLIVICIYLIISIGHTKGKDGIDINDFDKIPIEFILAFDVLVIILILAFINEFIKFYIVDYYYFDLSLLLTFYFILYSLGCLTIVSIIKRIKAKTIIKNSLTGKVCGFIFNLFKKFLKILSKIFNKMKKDINELKNSWPEEVKIIIFTFCFVIFAIIFVIIFGPMGIIIDLVCFGFVLYKFLIEVSCFERIEKNLKNMYEGENKEKLNSEDFSKNFQDIVKYINDISIGFENAIEEGIKSERLKTELITNVSHDIKTPLTSIINYVDLLKKENIDNEKAKEYIDVLDSKSQRLKKLTEDLVEASKASSGNVKLNIETININELIKQSTGEFEDKFKEKNLEIISSLPKEILYIKADNRYMYRIIENLFSNISKYALENSRVYIDIKKDNNKVKIDIKNISKEKLNISADELMQRFVRGDKSRTTEGSGLGISISKSLTEIQKGKFDLQIDGDLFKVQLEFELM